MNYTVKHVLKIPCYGLTLADGSILPARYGRYYCKG